MYWEYDSADQMTLQRSGTPVQVYFTFDGNGNLSVEHDVDSGRTYYTFDPRNLLTLIDFPGATPTNYFEFNAVPERVRKDDSTGGKKYTWDGIVQVLEKSLSNTTTQRMVKGFTPVDEIGQYAEQDLQGTVLSPHKNQVGTTQRMTTGAEAITNYYEFDAWGIPLETTQSSVQQFRFTGKELDPDSTSVRIEGLIYSFPFRQLSGRGVFLQRDPQSVINQFMIDKYIYAFGCPTRRVDPSGLQSQEECPASEKWCGPDATYRFKKWGNAIAHDYTFALPDEQEDLCDDVFDPLTAFGAFDSIFWSPIWTVFAERYRPCASPPPCHASVWLEGHCRNSGSLNYFLLGVLTRLCGKKEKEMFDLIDSYKGPFHNSKLRTLFGDYWLWDKLALVPNPDVGANWQESRDWAQAGLNDWPRGGKLPNPPDSSSTVGFATSLSAKEIRRAGKSLPLHFGRAN